MSSSATGRRAAIRASRVERGLDPGFTLSVPYAVAAARDFPFACLEMFDLGSAFRRATIDRVQQAAEVSPEELTLDGGAHPLVARLRRRLSVAARVSASHAEPLQLARYRPGEQYGLHLDVDPLGAVPRYATMLVYLNNLPAGAGGHTTFPKLNVQVDPIEVRNSGAILAQFGRNSGAIP